MVSSSISELIVFEGTRNDSESEPALDGEIRACLPEYPISGAILGHI
ncbi:hypothetical protein AG1IA_04650 [Rhizoctonia solani AG-1 IA]|uniref:Uncharacterized protein n=1 Tax=Thanatephorus cucumeris (strain AG1-IA) TaxID=983506 RepID=L8WTM5_THACA|nr:hypothetical protein AG1IA_04650 [Rhizoctonia solani AG-1 IA]